MNWLDYDTDNCSVQRTLDVIGDRWSVLILREVFNGIRRFDQVKTHTGISDSVLAHRLHKLVDEGILYATEYAEPGVRRRKEYRLTDAGLDLQPVLLSLRAWGDAHRAGPEGPSLEIRHNDCGARVDLELHCEAGHRIDDRRDVHAARGPGARRVAG